MSQTERIFHIDRSIREHGGVTVAEIAKKFEVCERQAKRDIEYMRDRLGAPIVWSVGRRQYKYNSSWDNLRFADEKSLLAFAFLKAIINEYHYVPVISNDILALLKEKIAGRYAGIAEKVSYELPDMESIDGDIAYALCQALLHSCELEITYTDSKGIESARVIAPLRLVNYSGKWYCVALDSKSSEMRTFAISRIRSAKTSQPCRKAISPPNSEIERYLSSSYGIFKGEPIGRATLRFYGGAARAVREQVWHMGSDYHARTRILARRRGRAHRPRGDQPHTSRPRLDRTAWAGFTLWSQLRSDGSGGIQSTVEGRDWEDGEIGGKPAIS